MNFLYKFQKICLFAISLSFLRLVVGPHLVLRHQNGLAGNLANYSKFINGLCISGQAI